MRLVVFATILILLLFCACFALGTRFAIIVIGTMAVGAPVVYALRQTLRILMSSRKPRVLPWETTTIQSMVWPFELDTLLHANNGTTTAMFDFGRMDFLTRAGVLETCYKNKWSMVVGSLVIRFRRELSTFSKYSITTELMCYDEKWIYLKQYLKVRGRAATVKHVKMVAKNSKGTVVKPADLLQQSALRTMQRPGLAHDVEFEQRLAKLLKMTPEAEHLMQAEALMSPD